MEKSELVEFSNLLFSLFNGDAAILAVCVTEKKVMEVLIAKAFLTMSRTDDIE